jgi:hypothetical protein
MAWYDKERCVDFCEIVGHTIVKIEGGEDCEEMVFHSDRGGKFVMWHEDD